MENRWAEVIFSGGFAGAATFLGMYLVLMREGWSRLHSAPLVSYSAGVLLGVGILHVYPEAQELTPHAPGFLLLSFVLFYFLEHHMFFHAGHEQLHHADLALAECHDGNCRNPHPLGVIAFAGMTLHSLIDGMIIGTGFEAGEKTGVLAALAVIAHEVPEGIAMVSILLHYGYPRRQAAVFTCLVAVATPFAALVTYALVREIAPPHPRHPDGDCCRILHLHRCFRSHSRIAPRPWLEGERRARRRDPDGSTGRAGGALGQARGERHQTRGKQKGGSPPPFFIARFSGRG